MTKTTDGVTLIYGLRVVTNNLRWGTVQYELSHTPGWWEVIEDDHGPTMMDPSRLSTRHPFGDPDPQGA